MVNYVHNIMENVESVVFLISYYFVAVQPKVLGSFGNKKINRGALMKKNLSSTYPLNGWHMVKELGFVVGQTNWANQRDADSAASNALASTKIIPNRFQSEFHN